MTRPPRVQRVAEHLIARACRRLPGEAGDERYREWAAELPAILSDPDIGSGVRRSARALSYAAGISRCARRLGRPGPPASLPARPGFPVRRVAAGVAIYLGLVGLVVGLAVAFHLHGPWPAILIVPVAAGFVAFCLVDLARADQVRYLPKWGWAIVCLVQIPLGGIVYLALGKIPRANLEPPAQP